MTSTSMLDELRERYAKLDAAQRGSKVTDHGDHPRSGDLPWPKDATRLSSVLGRHVSGLAQVGITHAVGKTSGVRTITVTSEPPAA